jgi:hypothetical protein
MATFCRSLFLVLCVLLGSALVARADITILDTDAGNASLGTLSVTTTSNYSGSGLDQVVLKFTSLVGLAAGSSVDGLSGTFTTGQSLNVGRGVTSNDWASSTARANYGGEANTSFINLDSILGTANYDDGTYRDTSGGITFNRSGTWSAADYDWTGTAASFLTGQWYTSGTYLSPTAVPPSYRTLATLYLSPGATFTYTGQMSFAYGGGSAPNVTFSTATPEPSMLALLASGLIGLMAYAWKKRK